jgi:hypothetical protein
MLNLTSVTRGASVAVLCMLLINATAFAQSVRWPGDTSSLGAGYDTLTGEGRGRCVSVPAKEIVAGEKVGYFLSAVDSESALTSAMSISVSAKYAGVEASGRFAETKAFNRFAAYLLVSIVVEEKSESIVDGVVQPMLLPDDLKLLTENFGRFRERCGDKFLATQSVGGSYFALIEVQTSSEVDRRDVYAGLSRSR